MVSSPVLQHSLGVGRKEEKRKRERERKRKREDYQVR
jgi:hypothetical protein